MNSNFSKNTFQAVKPWSHHKMINLGLFHSGHMKRFFILISVLLLFLSCCICLFLKRVILKKQLAVITAKKRWFDCQATWIWAPRYRPGMHGPKWQPRPVSIHGLFMPITVQTSNSRPELSNQNFQKLSSRSLWTNM